MPRTSTTPDVSIAILRRVQSLAKQVIKGAAIVLLCINLNVIAQEIRDASPAAYITELSSKQHSYPLNAQVWIDVRGDATIDTVTHQTSASSPIELHQYSNDKIQLRTGQAAWVRMRFHNLSGEDRWFLEVQRPTVDDVTLYCQNAAGHWQAKQAGDAVARTSWPIAARMPTFALKLPTVPDIKTCWLRIAHVGTPYYTPLVVSYDSTLLSTQQREALWLGLVFGVMLTSLGLALTKWWALRDISFGLYSLYLSLFSLFIASHLGLAQQFLWPSATTLANSMSHTLPLLAMFAALWFALRTLGTATPSWIRKVSRLILISLLLLGFAESASLNSSNFLFSSLVMLLALICLTGMIVSGLALGSRNIRMVATGFIPVAIGTLPALMRNIGWIETSTVSQYGMIWGSAIEMPVLLYALVSRSYGRRETSARAAGLPSQDALTGLPNMRLFLEQMHGSITRSHRFRHHYGLLLIELTNHAWFVKEHGREMADRALILTSTRLQQLVRDVDAVSRLDESHFVILVEGACSPRQLTKLAARVSASGHAPTSVLPVGASLRLSICCAFMPTEEAKQAGDDANAQLGWLIAAAEAMPPERRKLVRSIGF